MGMEPAPSATFLHGTSRDEFLSRSSSTVTGSSYQSYMLSISDTSSINEAPSSRSMRHRPGSPEFQAAQAAMRFTTPRRTFSPAAQSRAALFVPPHAGSSTFRREPPSPGGAPEHLSPCRKGRMVLM